MTKEEIEARLKELTSGPVKVKGKPKTCLVHVDMESDPPVTKTFTLREFMGDGRNEWNEYDKNARDENGYLVKLKDYSQTLIAKCCYKADNTVMTVEEVNSTFPTSAISQLFEACLLINGLVSPEIEDLEKND